MTPRTKNPDHTHHIMDRRDNALATITHYVPFIQFMGIEFDHKGGELTAVLPYDDKLIGNPLLPALHGGATAAFLETAAVVALMFDILWKDIESRTLDVDKLNQMAETPPDFPKTIDFTVDYLRPGLSRNAYARAHIKRRGRRYASVHTETWQDDRDRPFAQAVGHFLMPVHGG